MNEEKYKPYVDIDVHVGISATSPESGESRSAALLTTKSVLLQEMERVRKAKLAELDHALWNIEQDERLRRWLEAGKPVVKFETHYDVLEAILQAYSVNKNYKFNSLEVIAFLDTQLMLDIVTAIHRMVRGDGEDQPEVIDERIQAAKRLLERYSSKIELETNHKSLTGGIPSPTMTLHYTYGEVGNPHRERRMTWEF